MLLRLLVLSLLVMSAPVRAEAPQYLPGVHYELIQPPQPVSSTTGQVEVVEMLWYGCETCFQIQDTITQWLVAQGNGVKYVRMPAVTEANMVLLARAFYAADALDAHAKIDGPLFTAIHRYQRHFNSEDAVIEFFTEQGIGRAAAEDAMRSGTTAAKVRRAQLMARRYGIHGAPSLIVAGKYRVDPSLVQSAEELIAVVDFLVQSEHSAAR